MSERRGGARITPGSPGKRRGGGLAHASGDVLRQVLTALGEAVVDGDGVRIAYHAEAAPVVPSATVTPIR